jgi:hypothetical protein
MLLINEFTLKNPTINSINIILAGTGLSSTGPFENRKWRTVTNHSK